MKPPWEEPVRHVADFLTAVARRRPWAPAIIAPAGRDAAGRLRTVQLNYRQLDEDSDAIARGLVRAGLVPGTRTALMVRPGLDLFSLVFGLFKAGIVPVLVDPGLGTRNIGQCLREADVEAFIGVPAAHAARIALGWRPPGLRHLVTVGRRWAWGGITLDAVRRLGAEAGGEALPSPEPEDVAAILFTSGSTGPPKGAVYRHGNFVAQVRAIGREIGVGEAEVDLPTFPLFALFDPALGMTTVVPDMDPTRPAEADPRKLVEAIRTFGVTTMFGSPALLETLSRYGAAEGVKLPSLRRVISAGAPVRPAVIERVLGMLEPGARVLTPYGATESLPVAFIDSDEILGETAAATAAGAGVCVGRPVPEAAVRVIRIEDGPVAAWSDDLRVPDGEVGEITVRGPMVTTHYANRPEATASAKIDEDGAVVHRMGDVGYLDARGRLWFCGRKAHRVRTRDGETLFTVPCEAIFDAHPAVFRSALVGVAGEPVICVELEAEARGADRDALFAELRALAEAHPHTRAIRRFLVHPGFPVDVRHNAKIRREDLAAWAAGRPR